MKKVFISGIFVALIIIGASCSSEEAIQMREANLSGIGVAMGEGIGEAIAEGSLGNLGEPFTLVYTTPEEKEAIIEKLIDELADMNIANSTSRDEFTLDIRDNGSGMLYIRTKETTVLFDKRIETKG